MKQQSYFYLMKKLNDENLIKRYKYFE